MTNIDPSSPLRPVQGTMEPDTSNIRNGRGKGDVEFPIPQSTPSSTEPTLQLQNVRQVQPEASSPLGRWFRYHFGPIFGVLSPQELTTVRTLRTHVTNLERALGFGSHSLPKNGDLTQIVLALNDAKEAIAQLRGGDLPQQVTDLANSYHRYSDMPARINALERKVVHLELQCLLGQRINEYRDALREYSQAVTSQGIDGSWEDFKAIRGMMQRVAENLIIITDNDPTLNRRASIQSLIADVDHNGSKAVAILKLMSKTYPQHEKHLLVLFSETVRISRNRFTNLNSKAGRLIPLVKNYHDQIKEIARLEKIVADQSPIGRFAKVVFGNRQEELERVRATNAETLRQIHANEFRNPEEIEWLRTIAQTSPEVNQVFVNVAAAMLSAYRLNTQNLDNHIDARKEVAQQLDTLIVELKHRRPNADNVYDTFSQLVELIGGVHLHHRDQIALPKNYEKLSNLKKLEVLIKLHVPDMETKTAQLISLAKKKRLTEQLNTKIDEVAGILLRERLRREAPHEDLDEDDEGESVGLDLTRHSTPPVSSGLSENMDVVSPAPQVEVAPGSTATEELMDVVPSAVETVETTVAPGAAATQEDLAVQLQPLGYVIPPPPPPPPLPPSVTIATQPFGLEAASLTEVRGGLGSSRLNRPIAKNVIPLPKDNSFQGILKRRLSSVPLPEPEEEVSTHSDDDDEWEIERDEDQTLADLNVEQGSDSTSAASSSLTGTPSGALAEDKTTTTVPASSKKVETPEQKIERKERKKIEAAKKAEDAAKRAEHQKMLSSTLGSSSKIQAIRQANLKGGKKDDDWD